MSDWDTFDSPADKANRERREMAVKLQELYRQQDELKRHIQATEDAILQDFTEDFGEQVRTYDAIEVRVTRAEKWSWDAAKLEAILPNTGALPPYVKKGLTVDKRKFLRAPAEEQALLKPALTRNIGTTSISVAPRGAD